MGASLTFLWAAFSKNDYTDDVRAGNWHKKGESLSDKLNLDRKVKERIWFMVIEVGQEVL